tara:strand:+ start:233 stop:1831 length:1599 start_codon:yes stop_codon:yes gene_type:complete
MAALLLVLTLLLRVTVNEFQVTVNGKTEACVPEGGKKNSYGTHVETTTNASLWRGDKDATYWDLHYRRTSATTAQGGRCATASLDAITGTGVFEAEFYIHSFVVNGTGVFTINAEAAPFSKNTELDLLVINLADDDAHYPGESVIKSGKPEHTTTFLTKNYVRRWLRATLTKTATSCSTTIVDAATGEVLRRRSALKSAAVSSAQQECTLDPSASHIVINVRAREGDDAHAESFVSIRSVTWTSSSAKSASTVRVAQGAPLPSPASVGFFFWGYGTDGKPLVPASIFLKMAANATGGRIANLIIGGCGHSLGSIPESPWLAAQVAAAHDAGIGFVPLIAGCTLAQLRAMVFNASAVKTFVSALVADAVKHEYDGFNFDLEMGGFGAPEQTAFAAMLVKLQAALIAARPDRAAQNNVASACVGDTKNGVVAPKGVQAAPAGGAMLVDMGLYTSNDIDFSLELAQAELHMTKHHLVAGLSASTDSWPAPGPSTAQLTSRFAQLKLAGVRSVAVFGGNYDWLAAYEAPLREFLDG